MIQLKISHLRKQLGIGQKELADFLGVSPQTVSKWENETSMPDITLLPEIAGYFHISVDQLLGLKPLPDEEYVPSAAGTRSYWDAKLDYLKRTRTFFWNEDYIRFLIEQVWHISSPVNVLDCGCGYGFLGMLLMPLLPEGSSYTGIDFSETLISEGRSCFAEACRNGDTGRIPGKLSEDTEPNASLVLPAGKYDLICADFLTWKPAGHYDLVICQAVLRHIDRPYAFLEKMTEAAGSGGLVVCMDVNREIECDGLYIKGMDYARLCGRGGFRKMWKKEYENQGRDYSAAMKVPDMLIQLGLTDVDVRMNDRVNFVSPANPDYKELAGNFLISKGWDRPISAEAEETLIQNFMNHGMDREAAEDYCRKNREITAFAAENRDNLTYTHLMGFLISYGWKK